MQLEPLLDLGGVAVSFWSLSLGGLAGGLTAGLFGLGGGVVVIPLLIGLGIPPRLAAGSANVAILSDAAVALVHDPPWRRANLRLGLGMALAAVAGGQAGSWALGAFGRPQLVDQGIRAGLFLLLLWLAARLAGWRGKPGPWSERWLALPFLRCRGPWRETPASMAAPLLVALAGGLLSALLGVGGGVLMVPVLLALYPRPLHEVLPVSQLAVLAGCLSVSSGNVLRTGNLDPRLVLILILTGSAGALVGSRLRQNLDSPRLERMLAVVLLIAALRLGVQALGAPGVPLPAASSATRDWLAGFPDWCAQSPTRLWLGTVGLALGLTPALAWLQHRRSGRMGDGTGPIPGCKGQ